MIEPQGWGKTDREKGIKSGMISVFLIMLTLTLLNIISLSLFGEL
jgi:hypothetical protein